MLVHDQAVRQKTFFTSVVRYAVYGMFLMLAITPYSCSVGNKLALLHAEQTGGYHFRTPLAPLLNPPENSIFESQEYGEEDDDEEMDFSEEDDDEVDIASDEDWKCDIAEKSGPDFEQFAKKMGICLNGSENMDLMRAVYEWLGTPYRGGGCSKRGVDCSCLVSAIYKRVFGVQLSRTSSETYYYDVTPIKKEELEEGDLVYFRTSKKRRISHVGIYLKDGKFIHSSPKYGVVIADLDQEYFQRTFVAAGRVKTRGA